MHPLSSATTFQLALVIDTLMAERQLIQLQASLATHMAGPGSDLHLWLEDRLEEIDATVQEVLRVAIYQCEHTADSQDDIERMSRIAHLVIKECDLPDIGDLIAAHQKARAMDPESPRAQRAEEALFRYRPITAYDHAARARYLLSEDALDLSCWDTEDTETLLRSVA